jgi:hypothetical protein
MPRPGIALVSRRMRMAVFILLLGAAHLPESTLHAGSPPPPPDPPEIATFFQFIMFSPAPAEPCCRQAGPDEVSVRGTGELNWGPWDYTLLPCDYGEKMVDPADKNCRSVNDCLMLPVTRDCCGSLFLAGVSKKKSRRYLLLNHQCRPVLSWCDCLPGAYQAEDFKTSDDPDDIRLECSQGMCRTSLP